MYWEEPFLSLTISTIDTMREQPSGHMFNLFHELMRRGKDNESEDECPALVEMNFFWASRFVILTEVFIRI